LLNSFQSAYIKHHREKGQTSDRRHTWSMLPTSGRIFHATSWLNSPTTPTYSCRPAMPASDPTSSRMSRHGCVQTTWRRTMANQRNNLRRQKTTATCWYCRSTGRACKSSSDVTNCSRVTQTNGLSAAEHVRDIINSCVQTLLASRVLRTRSEWRRYSGYLQVCCPRQATERCERLVGIHVDLRPTTYWMLRASSPAERLLSQDTASFEELCETADEKLFKRIKRDKEHTLNSLLPPTIQ